MIELVLAIRELKRPSDQRIPGQLRNFPRNLLDSYSSSRASNPENQPR
jgi:hypothetical protein